MKNKLINSIFLLVFAFAISPSWGTITPAAITAEQAAAIAINKLQQTDTGLLLSHPRHKVNFEEDGIGFQPRGGGPGWNWQLEYIGSGKQKLVEIDQGKLRPQQLSASIITYPRGAISEQYHLHQGTIEQRFIISQPLALNGQDLIISGQINSPGVFEELKDGWQWRNAAGLVHLGDVYVYDAAGKAIKANMQVDATSTRISVDYAALADATYPVTIDPEIGANDFRISDMGGDVLYVADDPAVAWNATDNQYLVVWRGDDNTSALVDNEREIFGQRIDATTGAEIGTNDFRISDMGPDGDVLYGASFQPAVVWNAIDNQYLVVWSGDDNTGALVENEFEIYGQRIDAATGAEIGVNDFRISDMGADGDVNYIVVQPEVVWNATDNQYLVVWHGGDDTGALVIDEFEIYGQLIDAVTGAEIGANDFRISDMGADGDNSYDAIRPAVAWNATDNQYLVVWSGDDNTGTLVEDESEIFGQRIDATTGAELGVNDFRISDMGPDGDASYDAFVPAVAWNAIDNQYLVVWRSDDNTGALVDNEFEIYGQRIDAVTGAEIGANDFRISDMGPDGDTNYRVFIPNVVWNATDNQYLVVWVGDDNTGALVNNEREIFGQRIDAVTGTEIGANDFRITDMGPDGDISYLASVPKVAWNAIDNQYLVVWRGDDNTGTLVIGEFEIFGQRLDAATGAELGVNDFRISDMGGDALYDAFEPAVAWNSIDNQYLVVWYGDDNTGALVEDELEIFGQRIDAATGAELGVNDIRISDMGADGDASYDAFVPAVAWNAIDNQYLVVWAGDDNTGALVESEFEIFGQRIDATTGIELGANDFRISDMGPDGGVIYGAFAPTVAWNATDNQYLVVWRSDDNTGALVDNEFEIFGQRIDAATGAELGVNDFRISDMGPDGDDSYGVGVFVPTVTWNATNNQYLVVWQGDDNTGALVEDEIEIFGQRINAVTGAEIGTNDFRISDMGPDGDVNYDALLPAVAWNATNNQYLVVWQGDDNTGTLVDNESEIFGQRIDAATGAELGVNDFRISDMGPDSNLNYDAIRPAVAWNAIDNQYLVVWTGDDNTEALVNDELEIFGQRIDGITGVEIGVNDFRISDMGPDGDNSYDASRSIIAWNAIDNQYLVVWYGDDNTGALVDDEFEIFAQFISGLGLTTDLVTSKVVNNAAPAEGDSLIYTLSVLNNGPDDATGVSLTDNLPAGVSYVSDDGAGAYVSATGLWTIGALANGATATLQITVSVDLGTNGLTITNTTSAAVGDQADPGTVGDDLDAAIIVANLVTDLITTKVVNNPTPSEGDSIIYTLNVLNNGPDDATGVSLTDNLPVGVSYVSDDGAGAYVSATGVWTIGALANGATATLQITVSVDLGTNDLTITNVTSAAAGDQADPGTVGDDLDAAINVANLVTDLITTKVVNNPTPSEGDSIVYTLTVLNNGPDGATGVSLTDNLPAGVSYVSDDGSGAYVSATGLWTIGALANGATATLQITVSVDLGTNGASILNLITAAAGDQADPSTADDDLAEGITVGIFQAIMIPSLNWLGLLLAFALILITGLFTNHSKKSEQFKV